MISITKTPSMDYEKLPPNVLSTIKKYLPDDLYYFLEKCLQAKDNKIHQLEILATRDPLTGLYNRREFNKDLKSLVSRNSRMGHDFSLLLFDLDHFKRINDRYGHQEGDRILVSTVKTLVQYLRLGSLAKVYRYGGEEIAILLPDTSLHQSYNIAERLRRAVEMNGNGVTISVGVSCFDKNCSNVKDLIGAADTALYYAKSLGRNRAEVYRSEFEMSL